MKNDVTLGVYRIQDIPYEGMPKDFPRLVELHNLRGEALHDVFDMQQITEVISWETQTIQLLTNMWRFY